MKALIPRMRMFLRDIIPNQRQNPKSTPQGSPLNPKIRCTASPCRHDRLPNLVRHVFSKSHVSNNQNSDSPPCIKEYMLHNPAVRYRTDTGWIPQVDPPRVAGFQKHWCTREVDEFETEETSGKAGQCIFAVRGRDFEKPSNRKMS